MITERMNSRLLMQEYLREIARGCLAEKAGMTHDQVVELSETMMSLASSSVSADPEKMADLLAKDVYPLRAEKYLKKNWFLNIGISEAKLPDHEIEKRNEKIAASAKAALDIMAVEIDIVDDFTAESISNAIEKLADDHFRNEAGFEAGQGHGTPVLLREILGLPGDHDVCVMETNPRVVLNAAIALTQIGVEISPEQIDRLKRDAGKEDAPAPSM